MSWIRHKERAIYMVQKTMEDEPDNEDLQAQSVELSEQLEDCKQELNAASEELAILIRWVSMGWFNMEYLNMVDDSLFPCLSNGYWSSVCKFFCKQNIWSYKSASLIISITFIFDMCHRSWTVVTPAKYECDKQYLACIFTMLKI